MDALDRLLLTVDSDLASFFKPLADEIDRELAKPKPNISALERRIAARLALLYGTSVAEVPEAPLGRYARGALRAARAIGGANTPVSITEPRQGDTTARRLFTAATNLRRMLTANLRHFATAKPGRYSKAEVRQWFREFLTPRGAGDSLGTGGDHGLHETRRVLHTEAAREAGVGVRVAAILQGRSVGWQLDLSHTYRDECDQHARTDAYGLGPGIYPAAQVPTHPAHPFCKCRLVLAGAAA
jgi:hypothetical protein